MPVDCRLQEPIVCRMSSVTAKTLHEKPKSFKLKQQEAELCRISLLNAGGECFQQ
jgi:hypothetical protein